MNRSFEVYKNHKVTVAICLVSRLTIFFGIVFTVIQPILQHDAYTAFWTVFGPVFFAITGWLFYRHATRKSASVVEVNEEEDC